MCEGLCTSLSLTVRSATALFSRVSSASSCLGRRAWSILKTPVLSSPPVEGLLRDPYLARGLGHRAPLCYRNLGLP